MSLTPQSIVSYAVEAVEGKKAYNVVVLDISQISIISDYFIICSASSTTQVKAIAENVLEKLGERKIDPLRKEGFREGKWILLDYGDVIVHIFREEERLFYNLERLWGDAMTVDNQVFFSLS